jgi:hypothetical protein
MRDKAHSSLESIESVRRREHECSFLYGLHNMASWEKIKNEYKYFIIIPISERTIRVVRYTDDKKKAESMAGLDPRYVLLAWWEDM